MSSAVRVFIAASKWTRLNAGFDLPEPARSCLPCLLPQPLLAPDTVTKENVRQWLLASTDPQVQALKEFVTARSLLISGEMFALCVPSSTNTQPQPLSACDIVVALAKEAWHIISWDPVLLVRTHVDLSLADAGITGRLRRFCVLECVRAAPSQRCDLSDAVLCISDVLANSHRKPEWQTRWRPRDFHRDVYHSVARVLSRLTQDNTLTRQPRGCYAWTLKAQEISSEFTSTSPRLAKHYCRVIESFWSKTQQLEDESPVI